VGSSLEMAFWPLRGFEFTSPACVAGVKSEKRDLNRKGENEWATFGRWDGEFSRAKTPRCDLRSFRRGGLSSVVCHLSSRREAAAQFRAKSRN